MKFDDDKILLIALRERNEKAFDMIFQKYFKSIYQFMYHNVRSEANAEDLTQEVFVNLWEHADTPIVSLKGYLFAISRSTLVNWSRQGVNRLVFNTLSDEHQVALMVESEVDNKVSFDHLLSIIHRVALSMPERRLEVYRLRWVEGLPRKEIAKRMGITVTTVDIHLQKALEYLRVAVSKLPDEFPGLALLLLFL